MATAHPNRAATTAARTLSAHYQIKHAAALRMVDMTADGQIAFGPGIGPVDLNQTPHLAVYAPDDRTAMDVLAIPAAAAANHPGVNVLGIDPSETGMFDDLGVLAGTTIDDAIAATHKANENMRATKQTLRELKIEKISDLNKIIPRAQRTLLLIHRLDTLFSTATEHQHHALHRALVFNLTTTLGETTLGELLAGPSLMITGRACGVNLMYTALDLSAIPSSVYHCTSVTGGVLPLADDVLSRLFPDGIAGGMPDGMMCIDAEGSDPFYVWPFTPTRKRAR